MSSILKPCPFGPQTLSTPPLTCTLSFRSCKTRPYKDDDAPPKHLYLPIRWLDPPLSFQILAALFLIAVTMIVWKGGNANVAAGQGATAGRPGHRSGYSSIN